MGKTIALEELVKLIDGEIIQGESAEESVNGAYTSDLLSDVMANAKEGQALVTIQAHKNTIAVATLFGAPCIIICNNRPIPEDMISAAREEEVAIFRSSCSQYEVSGRIYSRLSGNS